MTDHLSSSSSDLTENSTETPTDETEESPIHTTITEPTTKLVNNRTTDAPSQISTTAEPVDPPLTTRGDSVSIAATVGIAVGCIIFIFFLMTCTLALCIYLYSKTKALRQEILKVHSERNDQLVYETIPAAGDTTTSPHQVTQLTHVEGHGISKSSSSLPPDTNTVSELFQNPAYSSSNTSAMGLVMQQVPHISVTIMEENPAYDSRPARNDLEFEKS